MRGRTVVWILALAVFALSLSLFLPPSPFPIPMRFQQEAQAQEQKLVQADARSMQSVIFRDCDFSVVQQKFNDWSCSHRKVRIVFILQSESTADYPSACRQNLTISVFYEQTE